MSLNKQAPTLSIIGFIFFILSAISVLSGCVSHTTILANEQGKMFRCAQAAYGVVPSILATSVHQDCVATAKEAGYTRLVSERHQ